MLAAGQAFDAGKPEQAATRLAAYVKRWGEDADTIELDARIKVALASRELDTGRRLPGQARPWLHGKEPAGGRTL